MGPWSGLAKRLAVCLAFAGVAGILSVGESAADVSFCRLEPMKTSLTAPGAVATDSEGKVYVSESGFNQVVVFDALGTYRKTLSGLDRPISLAVDGGGRLFVGNAGRGNVEIYSPELTLQGKLGSGDGEFGQPSGIAVDGSGTLYVADSKENVVKIYRPDGTQQSTIGGGTGTAAIFRFPVALALNPTGDELIVTDLRDSLSSREGYGGARVQVFTTSGTLVRSFGNFGRGDGLLVKPLGVAADGEGRIYVTDAFQNVVQVFDQSGSYLGTVHDAEHPLRTPLGIAFNAGGNKLYVCSLTAGKVEVFDISFPVESVTLTVSPAGSGQGTVTSEPAGIACPGACSAAYAAGTAVTLAAVSDSGSVFAGWSGACVGTGDCVLNMSQALEAVANFEVSAEPRSAPSDFNGDGLSDILWLDPSGHRVAVWLIDRDLITHAYPVASARRQGLGGVADVGGDGKADILWHSDQGTVMLWSMDGASIVATDELGPMEDAGWDILGLADFDGDGRADVLWRQAGSGSLRLWLLAGNTISADTVVASAPDPAWEPSVLGDFDGDGRTDILWRHARTGSLQVWFMNGAVARAGDLTGRSPQQGARIVGSGDFDGDGRADILWRQPADGSFSYWPLTDEAAETTVVLANSPHKLWRLLHTGDYNGDGRADLLVQRRSSHEVLVCLTVDAMTLQCLALGTAPVPTSGE